MYLVIRFDVLAGKMAECDRYIQNELLPYFQNQNEVQSVQVLEDSFIGWPEREIRVQIQDLSSLQNIMASDKSRHMKEQFTSFATDIQTQVMEEALK